MENRPAHLRLYQRWWQRPETFGLIKYFHPGFSKLVLPNEDLSEFIIEENGPRKGYTFYDFHGRVMCVEYSESRYVDNGPGKGYTFYYPGGIRAGVGALEICDTYDGERDIIYGGPLPGPNWTNHPSDSPPSLESMTRTAMKERVRERVPLSENMGLFYHPDALLAQQDFVILAGPSLFSPECSGEYYRLNQKLQDGTLEDSEMAQNWNVIVDQNSLVKLVDCTRNHDPTTFWNSKSGYVYPMLYIVPEGCYSWTPRDYSTWVPGDRIFEFLDVYDYKEGDVDPRIPASYWPADESCPLEQEQVHELYYGDVDQV